MEKSTLNQWEQQMKKKITKLLPKDYIEFKLMNNDLSVNIVNKSTCLTILNGDTWPNARKYIVKALEEREKKSDECNICMEEDYRFTGCVKCKQRWCVDCMFSIMRRNRGVIICPFCKHTIGQEMCPMHVEELIFNMKIRYAMMGN